MVDLAGDRGAPGRVTIADLSRMKGPPATVVRSRYAPPTREGHKAEKVQILSKDSQGNPARKDVAFCYRLPGAATSHKASKGNVAGRRCNPLCYRPSRTRTRAAANPTANLGTIGGRAGPDGSAVGRWDIEKS